MELKEIAAAVAEMQTTVSKRIDELEKYAEDLEIKFNRRGLGGETRTSAQDDDAASLKALSVFVRAGDDRDLKTMSVGSDPDGGYVVIPARSTSMTKKIFDANPMRRLARVEVITAGDAWEEPVDVDDIGATWVGETQSRPETDTAKLGLLRVPVHETYALQPITQRLLDDSYIDVGAWVEGKISDKFARQEGTAFVSGDGVKKPRGFLTYPTEATADATRPWGTLQYLPSGAADTITADALRDMVWGLRAPYRSGATWLMNSNTASVIDKLKNGDGAYIWRDSTAAGVPPTLLGYPVEFAEDMPDTAAGTLPIALGNWQKGYVVVEKVGIRLLRDPFSQKPYVLVYCYRRIGGDVANFEAIKLMKIGVS